MSVDAKGITSTGHRFRNVFIPELGPTDTISDYEKRGEFTSCGVNYNSKKESKLIENRTSAWFILEVFKFDLVNFRSKDITDS